MRQFGEQDVLKQSGISPSCLCACKSFKNESIHSVCVCACSVMSDSLRPHELWPARLLCPWKLPGKNIEWVANSFSRGSSRPRDQTCVS